MDAGRARVSARLECDLRAGWFRLAADHHGATPGARFPQWSADGDRLSHSQRLAIRHRGTRIARRGSWPLLECILCRGRATVAEGHGAAAMLRAGKQRCRGGADATIVEECYWKTLSIIRQSMEASRPMVEALAAQLRTAQARLNARGRKPSRGPAAHRPRIRDRATALPMRRLRTNSHSNRERRRRCATQLGRVLELLQRSPLTALSLLRLLICSDRQASTKRTNSFPAVFTIAARIPARENSPSAEFARTR